MTPSWGGVDRSGRIVARLAFTLRPHGTTQFATRNGKSVSVILPTADYREMIERAEDADDAAWLKRARQKPMLTFRLANALRPARRSNVEQVLLERAAENLHIIGLQHAEFARVERIKSRATQKGGSTVRRALIEEQFHPPSLAGD